MTWTSIMEMEQKDINKKIKQVHKDFGEVCEKHCKKCNVRIEQEDELCVDCEDD